jgi:hypothetical protein
MAECSVAGFLAQKPTLWYTLRNIMETVKSKSAMSEEDIKRFFILFALESFPSSLNADIDCILGDISGIPGIYGNGEGK